VRRSALSMSGQGGGEAAAAAAAAPVPASSEQERQRRALEDEMRELKEKIERMEAKADVIENEVLEIELRRSIAANTERLNRMEAKMDRLEAKVEQLSAPVRHPTAAGGCSFSSQHPCASSCLALHLH
jgi:DNA repair exonuclease SbcCD ATPase subunit